MSVYKIQRAESKINKIKELVSEISKQRNDYRRKMKENFQTLMQNLDELEYSFTRVKKALGSFEDTVVYYSKILG